MVIASVQMWLKSLLARYRAGERGATAVEFAFVALPFIFIIFSVFEIALILLLYSTLENGMADAARTIRTGSLQTSGTATATSFRNTICADLGWLQSDCQAHLQVDVRTMSQFNNPSEPDPFSTGTFDPTKVQFSPGAQGSIVLVRAFYQWPLIMPVMNAALSRNNNGVAIVTAVTTFRNEPY